MNSLLALVLLAVPTAEPPKTLSHHYEAPVVRVINQLTESRWSSFYSVPEQVAQCQAVAKLAVLDAQKATGYESRHTWDSWIIQSNPYQPHRKVYTLSYLLPKLTGLCQSTWFSLDGSYKFEGWLVSISADHESVVLANNDKTINVQIKKLAASSQKRILNILACCDRLTLAINIFGTGPLLAPLPSSRQTLLQRILPEVQEFEVGVWLLWFDDWRPLRDTTMFGESGIGGLGMMEGMSGGSDNEEMHRVSQKIPGKLLGRVFG